MHAAGQQPLLLLILGPVRLVDHAAISGAGAAATIHVLQY